MDSFFALEIKVLSLLLTYTGEFGFQGLPLKSDCHHKILTISEWTQILNSKKTCQFIKNPFFDKTHTSFRRSNQYNKKDASFSQKAD